MPFTPADLYSPTCSIWQLLTQLHADLYANPPDHHIPGGWTVVYRKLLSEVATKLGKALKLIAVTISIPSYICLLLIC